MTRIFRIGARASPLSMTQARRIQARVGEALRIEPGDQDHRLPLFPMVSSGDRMTDRRLIEAGGKGLFTKELDEALLGERIDLAVHSLKDLPTRLPGGLALACVPERADPRDAFISLSAGALADLPPGAVIGTASLRRQAQVLYARPDLVVRTLRGNVETRLARIADGSFDATFLAMAGLERLGLAGNARSLVDPDTMPPAAGQGALAVTARAGDVEMRTLLARLEASAAAIETAAERAFLAALDGSCRTPIAAHARLDDGGLDFLGETLTPDGRSRWRRRERLARGPNLAADAVALGDRLGRSIRTEAGDQLLRDS
jgi:hydroxymethylbilane synthase